MDFDWDDGNRLHIAKHGVTPQETEEAVLDPKAIVISLRTEKDESRARILGRTLGGRILMVIFTLRGDKMRPITAYVASRAARKAYQGGRNV